MSDQSGETGTEADRTYEGAVARLDEIIARLDSGDAELRETLDLCAEAKGLIEYCAGELAAVDQGLRELRLDELAAELAGPSPAETAPGRPQPSGDADGPPEAASGEAPF